MTTLRDWMVVDQNLIKLKLFIEKQLELGFKYNIVFCLVESKQVIKNNVCLTMDPPTFLRNNFPNLPMKCIPYNDTIYSMNSIILGSVDYIKTLETNLHFKFDSESKNRSFPIFALNNQEFIFGHIYFPRSENDIDTKIKHLRLINEYAVKNNAVAFGDGNISVYNKEESIKIISNNLHLTSGKTFFGTTRDKYANQNIKSIEDMSFLDFVVSPFKDKLEISIIEPI